MAIDVRAPVAAEAPDPPAASPRGRRDRVTLEDRVAFTERLALLLETGMPLHAALQALAGQTASPALVRVLGQLLDDVTGGRTFSQALARHADVFPASYVSLIAAAEAGGFLPQVLAQLVDLDEKAQKLRSTLVAAVTYPAFLVAFSALIVLLVLVWVFPRFGELFDSIRDRLPWSTVLLLALSDVLRHYWHACGVAVVGGSLLVARWARRPEGRASIGRWLLRLPLVRGIAVRVELVRTLRVLGLSLENGVAIVPALAAAREVASNVEFEGFLARVERSVSEGGTLGSAFAGAPFLPPLVGQLIATGEQGGNLPLVLGRLSDFYQRELERRLGMLSRLAEPLLLAFMGVGVAVIVSSLLLPIFRLSAGPH